MEFDHGNGNMKLEAKRENWTLVKVTSKKAWTIIFFGKGGDWRQIGTRHWIDQDPMMLNCQSSNLSKNRKTFDGLLSY